MLVGLINLDSIGFYQNVQRIVSESQKVQAGSKYRSQSPWLNLDEAVTVISCAKERAFGKEMVITCLRNYQNGMSWEN